MLYQLSYVREGVNDSVLPRTPLARYGLAESK